MYPADLKYSKEHEWIKVEGNTGRVGITHHAQNSLGDIVFVELPKVGRQLKVTDGKMENFGVVESVKAVSDLFSPVNGKVLVVNQAAEDSPELVNREPYVRGWLVEVELADLAELDKLMTAAEYEAFLSQAEGR